MHEVALSHSDDADAHEARLKKLLKKDKPSRTEKQMIEKLQRDVERSNTRSRYANSLYAPLRKLWSDWFPEGRAVTRDGKKKQIDAGKVLFETGLTIRAGSMSEKALAQYLEEWTAETEYMCGEDEMLYCES